jgi:hypothetical protein
MHMTPQEKLEWFWTFGQVPGTIFDDYNDRTSMKPQAPRRRYTRHLLLDLWAQRQSLVRDMWQRPDGKRMSQTTHSSAVETEVLPNDNH